MTRKSEPYLPGSKDQGKIEKISLTVKVNELDSVVSRRTIFYTEIPQVECGKMSSVFCNGKYTNEGESETLREIFTFLGDKTYNIYIAMIERDILYY